MAYERPITSGGGVTERWPRAGTSLKAQQNTFIETFNGVDTALNFRPVDYFIEFPRLIQGTLCTHLKVLPTGFDPTTQGTWVETTDPTAVCFSATDGCVLDESIITTAYCSTDGATVAQQVNGLLTLRQDNAGACAGPP